MLVIAIGMVRTKVMAVLLGPAGFGLLGVYGSIVDLAVSVAGMGVGNSGVRQIAEAVGTRDTDRIARTITVLRRTVLLLGIIGGIFLVVASRKVSILTFSNEEHAGPIAILAAAVSFRLLTAGQSALIQGMRRIGDLAWMGVLGAASGTVFSVTLVYFMGVTGVAPSLVGGAAAGLLISWWYSRKVKIEPVFMFAEGSRHEAASLLKLGVAFMASGLLTMGAAYAVRTMVLRTTGLEAAGFYQAAWTLGGLYVGMILQAMGTDFYPRLTGVARDNVQANRLVNEQAQVSLLLAGPGVIATLAFAPLLMTIFYSEKFVEAGEVLRWIGFGMALRVITWPMGFIIVAKGEQTIFFLTELAWTVVNIGLSWVCMRRFGLSGAGIAFFGSYVFHGLMIYPIVRRLSGFRWSTASLSSGLFFLTTISTVFVSLTILPLIPAMAVGITAVLLSIGYSLRGLLKLVPVIRIPAPILRLLVGLRLCHRTP